MQIKIKTLTPEEIQTLQVDQALRLLGENASLLNQLNAEIGQAIQELGQAKVKLDKLRNDKQTIIEINRALKVIAQNG